MSKAGFFSERANISILLVLFAAAVTGTAAQMPDIAASDQSPNDNTVDIDGLFLNKPGFVVIHADNNGRPGAVIGYSGLVAGAKKDFKVAVDTEKTSSRVYAMLHYDDDGDRLYGFPDKDKPVISGGGAVVKPINIR